MRIVIAGGSGQLGRLLSRHFHAHGHQVVVLGRYPRPEAWEMTAWNGRDLGAWAERVDGAGLVINLTGRSVNCRYTEANRREILETRVNSTHVIGQAIARAQNPPPLWINASTATIYRHSLDEEMDEDGELGGNEKDIPSQWRFSVEVALEWERALYEADTPFTRKIALRSSMVMNEEKGGVFDTLLGLVRRGFGGTASSGEQFVSWIHGEDFLRSIDFLIEHEDLRGAINVCSPHPLPNWQFMRELRQAFGAPVGLPAPRWLLEIGALLLRTETELVLKSRRVIPGRLLHAGFVFRFPEWGDAAEDLVARANRAA